MSDTPVLPLTPVKAVLHPLTPPPVSAISNALTPPPLRAQRIDPIRWLAGISLVLVVFLVLLPAEIRALMVQRLQSQALLVSMLLVFILVALSLVWSAGQKLDVWVFLTFNLRGFHPLWLDRMMLGFTQAGNGISALVFAVVLFLAGERFLAYELVLGTLTLWLAVVLIKTLAHRSRPFIHITQARIVGYRARGLSFPSGHTSQAFFVAVLLIEHFHPTPTLATVFYALALLVGITRICVGAHCPRDVLAGAILGSSWGVLGAIVERYLASGMG